MTKFWASPPKGNLWQASIRIPRYRVRIRRQGKTQTRIFLTKKEATHWAQQQEGLLLAGLAGIPQKRQHHTLAEAVERYRHEVFLRKKPSTARSQKHLLPFILIV